MRFCADGKENLSNNTDVLSDVLRETPRLIHRGLFCAFGCLLVLEVTWFDDQKTTLVRY